MVDESQASQDLNKSLSNEEFIDNYFKEITDYNVVCNKLYEDILQKVMYHINSNVLSDLNVTDRTESRKSKRSAESEELISSLKTEVEFLRDEIREKNELIKTLSSTENCQKNKTKKNTLSNISNLSVTNTVDVTHSNSNVINDSLNGFNDVDSQLTAIRKQKHLLYNDFKESQKVESKKRKSVVVKDSTKKSVIVVGDSMLNGIDDSAIKDENFDVHFKYFSGAKVADISEKMDDFISQKPDCLILHVGTNNAPNMSSNKIIDEILTVKHRIEKEAPELKVVISAPIVRTDNGKAALTIRNVNKHLQQLDMDFINNSNINHKDLGRKGLHLSKYAMKFSLGLDIDDIGTIPCPDVLCNGREDGNYAHEHLKEKSPNIFVQCTHGQANCQSCWPDTLMFNEKCNQCVYTYEDECQTTKHWESSFVSFCPDVCPGKGATFSGNMADPYNPYHYTACWKGVTVGCVTCPDGLLFNEKNNTCLYDGLHMTEPDNPDDGYYDYYY